MCKQYIFYILTVITLTFSSNVVAQIDTIPLTLDTLTTTGVCADNLFEATFTANGTHQISITPELFLNANPISDNNCSDTMVKPIVYIVIDSISTTLLLDSTSLLTGSWFGELDTTAVVTIRYHVYIDCSAIPLSDSGAQNINLVQTFTDPGHFYSINGGVNTHQVSNIPTPRMIGPFALNVGSSYLNTTQLNFNYENSGGAPLKIKFSFLPDSTNYCSQLAYTNLQFKVGTGGVFQALNPDSLTSVVIPQGEALIIQQSAFIDTCLSDCDSATVFFHWECDQPPSAQQIMCNHCQDIIATPVSFLDDNFPEVKLERLTPSFQTASYDSSCFNDTLNMPTWKYRITNSGVGAVDSVWVELLGFNDDFKDLSLIPMSSIVIQSNCPGCIDTLTFDQRTNALCSSFIPDPLNNARFLIKNFHQNDTMEIEFKTFRCASDDSILFDAVKTLNQWRLKITGIGICGNPSALDQTTSPLFGSYAISGHSLNGTQDMTQFWTFTPVVTDLSVPVGGAVFGDRLTQEIELKGGFNHRDRQAAGCQGLPCSVIDGYLKAVITCEVGLIVPDSISSVRLKYFIDSTLTHVVNPVYFHTQVPDSVCQQGSYSFYFELGDTLSTIMLDSGYFEFTIQACCDADLVEYSVDFYLLPDPDNCNSLSFPAGDSLPPVCSGTGCTWIPLAHIPDVKNIHCPGCTSPGIIVSDYVIRRSSLGFQDSNNDGIADSALTPITYGSPWYNNLKSFLKPHHSAYNDYLEDFLTSHFQDGDIAGGYVYQQMEDLNARFNYLQLQRTIPNGLDTVNLIPYEFTLYIDEPDTTNPNCIDCASFAIDSNAYRTVLQLSVPDTGLYHYLQLDAATNHYFFTFESLFDSLGSSGNLYNPNFAVLDSLNPFNEFKPFQKYRLHVRYKQCGMFLYSSSAPITSQNQISKTSAILNRMYLSGIAQGHNYDNQQPNSISDLDSAGWTFNPDSTQYQLVDSTFTATYTFYCETFGRNHFFFAHTVSNRSRIDDNNSCHPVLKVIAEAALAGNFLKVYPYEYRPVSLYPNQIQVRVPDGYSITSSAFMQRYTLNGTVYDTPLENFPSPGDSGTFAFHDSTMGLLSCLTQTPSSIPQSDSSQYLMSEFMHKQVHFTLSSDSCLASPVFSSDSLVMLSFGVPSMNCYPFDTLICQPDSAYPKPYPSSEIALYILPFFDLNSDSATVQATTHQVCWPIEIDNTFQSLASPYNGNTTNAPFVFLIPPDSASYPFFQNWVFYGSSGDTIFENGGLIPLDSLLQNQILSGQVCTRYISCEDSVDFDFLLGWNCDAFPDMPLDQDSVCFVTNLSVSLQDAPVQFGAPAKTYDSFVLCDIFEITATYPSQNAGYFYPDSAWLDSLPPGLIPQYAWISTCSDTLVADTLTFIGSGSWAIDSLNMAALGLFEGAFASPTCLQVTVGLMAECEFMQNQSLPDLNLSGTTFCGDTMTHHAGFSGGLTMTGSICTDCFTIEKTALQANAFALDTVDFQVVVCGFNDTTYTIPFSDQFPLNFEVTSAVPDSVTVPGNGCDTTIISGYYTQGGFCGSPDMFNTATIYFSGDSLSDTACLTVYPLCAATADTIVADSTFTSTMPANVNNLTIFLAGRLYVDDAITFNNCTIFVNTGGQIILQSGGSITLDSTMIQGCDFMWQGIFADTLTAVGIRNGSTIRDANRAVEARDGSDLKITHSSFEDNVWGIYVPANLNGNTVNHAIYGNRFGLFGSSFKTGYPGQDPFGSIPNAGIEVNDGIWQFGGATVDSNYFYNMNTGILGFRSTMKVTNNKFDSIYVDSAQSTYSDWHGSAVASIGKLNSVSSKLTVLPVTSGDWTMVDCEKGIYTDVSDLMVEGVQMTGMNIGIASTRCISPMSSLVKSCVIEAEVMGIDWRINNGAQAMTADNNIIRMSKPYSVGIWLAETSTSNTANYLIKNNSIVIENGFMGVYGLNIFNSAISDNMVDISGTVNGYMAGIVQEGGLRNVINCNIVDGDDHLDTLKLGIMVDISTETEVICNQTDSTGFGVYFGGICPETSFRGNALFEHFNGLRLNSVAVIDTQSHAGNLWLGNYSDTLGNWGAVNMNADSSQALLSSLFEVNPTPNNALLPSFPDGTDPAWPDDNGWFQIFTTGDAFACDSIFDCHFASEEERSSSEGLMLSIAGDSSLTMDFIPESKSMAKIYLYDEIKRDSSLLSNLVYEDFVLDNEEQAIGELYETKKLILEGNTTAGSLDSVMLTQYEWFKQLSDSVFVLDSLELLYPGTYMVTRNNLIGALSSIKSEIDSLLLLANEYRITKLNTAAQMNNLIQSLEIPEANEKTINSIDILFHLDGKTSLVTYENQLISIASQCPFQGGQAVYRARALLSMLNAQIQYNDLVNCSQSGIYRSASSTSKVNPQITLIPNPADESVIVKTSGFEEGICKLYVKNKVNQMVSTHSFPCQDKEFRFDTSKLPPGIYTVLINVANKNIVVEKLIIVR